MAWHCLEKQTPSQCANTLLGEWGCSSFSFCTSGLVLVAVIVGDFGIEGLAFNFYC